MGLTLATRQAQLDALFDVPVFIGFSSTTPDHTGANFTEPTIGTGGYARIATTVGDWANATAANPSVATNVNDFDSPTATAAWAGGATMTHHGLFVAATGGTPFDVGALTNPKAVGVDDFLRILAGQITISSEYSTS